MEIERVTGINVYIKSEQLHFVELISDLCIIGGFGGVVLESLSSNPSLLRALAFSIIGGYGIFAGNMRPKEDSGSQIEAIDTDESFGYAFYTNEQRTS